MSAGRLFRPLLMKTALFFIVTLVAIAVIRAEDKPPDDFADIKWGESMEVSKVKVLLKPGVKFTTASPDGATLFFEGGTFATFPATKWEFTFVGDQFTEGKVYLTPSDPNMPSLRQAYETLKKAINAKYRKVGQQRGDANHSATYWRFNTRKGSWQIESDVDARRESIRLTYSFSPSRKPGIEEAKDL